jgi:hypothetical protein
MADIIINKQDSKDAQAAIKLLFEILPKSARGIHNIAYTFGLISRETGIPADQATDLIMAWSERLRTLPNFKELYPLYRKLSLYRYQIRYAVQSAYKRTNDMPSSARFKTLTGKKAPAASFWDKSDDLDKVGLLNKAAGQMKAGAVDAEKEKLRVERTLTPDSMVAIEGSSYFGPISVLLEKLEKYVSSGSGEVRTDNAVNGFACSICLLAVACLESYIIKIRSADKSAQSLINREPHSNYMRKLYQDFPFVKELVEIYMLRDMIVHNDLWKTSCYWYDEDGLTSQEINNGSDRDVKYGRFVDADSGKTKSLCLNISPMKVDASDASKMLHTVWNTLIFLEKKNSVQCHVSHLTVRYKSKMVKFGKVIGLPETCT